MQSIRSVYKIGNGPSSSHTVGPYRAATYIKNTYPDADRVEVVLYGSLAYTGAGHGTRKAIKSVLNECNVSVDTAKKDLPHPNTMLFRIYRKDEMIKELTILSIGGGSIRILGEDYDEEEEIYTEKNFTDFMTSCKERDISLVDYLYEKEGEGIKDFLREIWHTMVESVERGLKADGILPGGLNVSRKAKTLNVTRCYNESSDVTMNRLIASYAYAVSEENASEHVVVTAPTCGSCGVIPSVLYHMRFDRGFPEDEILDALLVAGLIGNIIRTNASISGAECGCQAEIGSACSMAAAAIATLNKLNIDQVEYSAETAMEHNLGLTCDPVKGLVQIPCIERNAVAAMRAFSSVNLSRFLYATRKISLDEVIETMYVTGKDMNEKYKETSHGGLAVIYEADQ